MPRRRRHQAREHALNVEKPNGATVFRTMHLLPHSDALQQETSRILQLDPELVARDEPILARVEAARTLAELLDLAAESQSLASIAWRRKFRTLRLGAASATAERLAHAGQQPDPIRRHTEEALIPALFQCGQLGGEALLRIWPTLSDAGAASAAMVLGKLGIKEGADPIWALYERLTARAALPHEALGALWGLADLHDPRAGQAAFQHLVHDVNYFERDTLLVMAADVQLVPAFLRWMNASRGQDKSKGALWIFIGIAQRLGHAATVEALRATPEFSHPGGADALHAAVDGLLGVPNEYTYERFPLLAPDWGQYLDLDDSE